MSQATIMGYYKNYTTSAAIEAVNGLLQLARRRGRGADRRAPCHTVVLSNIQGPAHQMGSELLISSAPLGLVTGIEGARRVSIA